MSVIIDMHSKLQKYVDTPIRVPGRLRKQPILISDSKGNYLRNHSDLIEQFGYNIEFQCRGGSRFADHFNWLWYNLQNKVDKYGQIILYVFLGTCDLSLKKGKYIELRHDDDRIAVTYLQHQINRFLNFVSNFPTVSIVFLEIPPYSLQVWNQSRGHRDPSSFRSQDLVLYERISLVNEYIKCINEQLGVVSPRFNLDLLRCRKAKGANQGRTSINFSNYKDGVHPKQLLARCWMKRIVLLIFRDCV